MGWSGIWLIALRPGESAEEAAARTTDAWIDSQMAREEELAAGRRPAEAGLQPCRDPLVRAMAVDVRHLWAEWGLPHLQSGRDAVPLAGRRLI